MDRFRDLLHGVLNARLVEADYLTHTGLVQLFDRLYQAARRLPDDAPEHDRLGELLLATGLAPDDFFRPARERRDKAEGLNYYVCEIEQPLGGDWAESAGCLPGQSAWTGYFALWGVLAHNEEDAGREALDWQDRCAGEPARISQCHLEDAGYADSPGIVWQGARQAFDSPEETNAAQ